MTNEEKINRLRIIQSRIPIHNRDEFWDFETLEAAIKDIETLSEIESRLGNVFEEEDDRLIAVNMFKELEAGIRADNRLIAVSGMSTEELTDAFTKGYRLVSPEAAKDGIPDDLRIVPKNTREQIPDIRVTTEEAAEAIQNLTKAGISQEDIEASDLPLYDQEPCDTCGYEEGSIYCKEHCPHEAKIDQEPISTKLMLMEANINGYAQGLKDSSKAEREPCADLISREGTLTAFADYVGSGMSMDDYDALWDIVAKMPAVNPTKTEKWIHVSERLPEDGQSVLFCDIDDDIMIGHHVKGRLNTHFTQDGTYEDMKNVRAWMPLPKPYEP